jgi:hypothetical protein
MEGDNGALKQTEKSNRNLFFVFPRWNAKKFCRRDQLKNAGEWR